jgi:hypothetical protein
VQRGGSSGNAEAVKRQTEVSRLRLYCRAHVLVFVAEVVRLQSLSRRVAEVDEFRRRLRLQHLVVAHAAGRKVRSSDVRQR